MSEAEKIDRLLDLCARNDAWIQHYGPMLEGIHRATYGYNGTPGITTRLDRVEQREAWRGKLLWVAISAAAALWAKQLAALFGWRVE